MPVYEKQMKILSDLEFKENPIKLTSLSKEQELYHQLQFCKSTKTLPRYLKLKIFLYNLSKRITKP